MKKQTNKAPPQEIVGANGVKRIVSGIVDASLVYALVIHAFKTYPVTSLFRGYPENWPNFALGFWCYILFVVLPHSVLNQSLGQALVGIKLISIKNNIRLGILTCFMRDTIYLPLLILMPWSVFSKNGQAMHDKLAGSRAIEVK